MFDLDELDRWDAELSELETDTAKQPSGASDQQDDT
jgi:hypothetical protein